MLNRDTVSITATMLVVVLLLCSCSSFVAPQPNNVVAQYNVRYNDTEDRVNFTTLDDQAIDATALLPILQQIENTDQAISIALVTSNSEVNERFAVGKYEIRVFWDRHNIGGCINRQNVRHLNFLIKNRETNHVYCDVHVPIWWNNGPQAGIYITKGPDHSTSTLYCTKTEGKYTAIKENIRNGLLKMHFANWTATAIAATAAAIIVIAFSLSWA